MSAPPEVIELRLMRDEDGTWCGYVELDDDPRCDPRLVRPGGVYADPVTAAQLLVEQALEMQP